MVELSLLAVYYAIVIAFVAFCIIAALRYVRQRMTPPRDVPAWVAPVLVVVLAVLLIYVAVVDSPTWPGGALSRVFAVLVLSWLGLFLWRRT